MLKRKYSSKSLKKNVKQQEYNSLEVTPLKYTVKSIDVESALSEHKIDLELEGDGIDDAENTEKYFINKITKIDENIPPPRPGMQAWPKLPEHIKGIDQSFFREPDFVASTDTQSFKENFVKRAKELKWVHKKGLWQIPRHLFGTVGLSLTGVGVVYNIKKHKRVEPEEIGFCTDFSRQVHLLFPGHHYEPNPTHGKIQTYLMNKERIHYLNRGHIIRVQPGKYVVATINNQYVLLKPKDKDVGIHMLDEPSFKFIATINQNKQDIVYGPINIITVMPNQVAKIHIDNKPYVLFPGVHEIQSGTFKFSGFSAQSVSFDFGAIHHYYVKPGKIGMVKVNNTASFLNGSCSQNGSYWFYTSKFFSKEPANPYEEQINFDPLTRVLIDSTKTGIFKDGNGTLKILDSGTHVIALPNIFKASIPNKIFNHTVDVKAITQDPLDVKLKLVLSYQVSDPIKACIMFPKFKDLQQAVIDQSVATVCDIIKNMRLENALLVNVKDDEKNDMPVNTGENVKKKWHQTSDEYKSTLAKNLSDNYGVHLNLKQWGYHTFDLADQKQQDQLTKAVYQRAQNRAKESEYKAKQQLAKIEKERIRIETESEMQKKVLEAKTSSQVNEIKINMQVEEINRIAKAKAQEIIIISEAERQATKNYPERLDMKSKELVANALKGANLIITGSGSNSTGACGALMMQLFNNQLLSSNVKRVKQDNKEVIKNNQHRHNNL